MLNTAHLPRRLQYVKAGFAGDNFPSAMFPAMVGRPMMRSDQVEGVEIKVRADTERPATAPRDCAPRLRD